MKLSIERRNTLLLIFIIVLVEIAALPIVTFPIGSDQGEFATIARGILDGKAPYADLWNPKPPAIFYVYAVVIGILGEITNTLRVIDLFLAPFVCVSIYWLGLKLSRPRMGLWAALIFSTLYFRERYWNLTQNDGIAILPMVLAVICTFKVRMLPGGSRAAQLYAFWAGFLCVFALWFKYPFVWFVLMLVLAHALLRGRAEFKGLLKEGLAFSIGGMLIGFGGIVYMAAIGNLDDLIESARVTQGYTRLSYDPDVFIPTMRERAGSQLVNWSWVFFLLLVWFISSYFRQRPQREWLTIRLWLLGATGGMLMQAKGYGYHWLPMAPPLALMAADSLELLVKNAANTLWKRHAKMAYIILSAIGAMGLLGLIILKTWENAWRYITQVDSQMEYYSDFNFGGDLFVASDSLAVSNYLKERVPKGDGLFIYGFRPEVYYMTGLESPTRFYFNFPIAGDWYPDEWREEAVKDLAESPPAYILVTINDHSPDVTGRNEDSYTMLQSYTALHEWMDANYDFETQIGNFLLYRRKGMS